MAFDAEFSHSTLGVGLLSSMPATAQVPQLKVRNLPMAISVSPEDPYFGSRNEKIGVAHELGARACEFAGGHCYEESPAFEEVLDALFTQCDKYKSVPYGNRGRRKRRGQLGAANARSRAQGETERLQRWKQGQRQGAGQR